MHLPLLFALALLQASPKAVLAEFAPYPGSEKAIPVGDELSAGVVTFRAVAFKTRDSPLKVLRFYADAFHEEGLFLAPFDVGRGAVSGIDPRKKVQKVVWARFAGEGTTEVILSLAPFGFVTNPPPKGASPIPLPAACDRPTRAGSRDGSLLSTVITLECPLALGAALDAAGNVLAGDGYVELKRPVSPEKGVKEWRKGDESWVIRAHSKAGKTVLVYVGQSRVHPAPEGADGGVADARGSDAGSTAAARAAASTPDGGADARPSPSR